MCSFFCMDYFNSISTFLPGAILLLKKNLKKKKIISNLSRRFHSYSFWTPDIHKTYSTTREWSDCPTKYGGPFLVFFWHCFSRYDWLDKQAFVTLTVLLDSMHIYLSVGLVVWYLCSLIGPAKAHSWLPHYKYCTLMRQCK